MLSQFVFVLKIKIKRAFTLLFYIGHRRCLARRAASGAGRGPQTGASALTRAYLARIEAYDRAGPALNSVREVNPDALAIAAVAPTASEPTKRRPLAGIPILVKDNIATGDRQHTTAGSLALADARAKRDATARRAAARRRRGDPRQGQPDRVRQYHRDRHALRIQLAGRPGEEPLCPALDEQGRADRAARRVELGLGGRGGGGAVRGGDRHRDLGLAVEPGDAERARHGQADRRPHQPRRHCADLAQPGHRRAADPHRARRGDPAQRAGCARPTRPGDPAPAAAGRLHRQSSIPTASRAPGSACRAIPPIPADSISAAQTRAPAR